MAANPFTSMPPKTLALVVVGGVGAGLIWRRFAKAKAGGAGGAITAPTAADSVDVNQLALSGSSTGNLGAGSAAGGSTSSYPDPTSAREVGSITLPVVRWVVTVGGNDYLTDGTTMEPLNSGAANPPTVPDNTAQRNVVSPTYSDYAANALKYQKAVDPAGYAAEIARLKAAGEYDLRYA